MSISTPVLPTYAEDLSVLHVCASYLPAGSNGPVIAASHSSVIFAAQTRHRLLHHRNIRCSSLGQGSRVAVLSNGSLQRSELAPRRTASGTRPSPAQIVCRQVLTALYRPPVVLTRYTASQQERWCFGRF